MTHEALVWLRQVHEDAELVARGSATIPEVGAEWAAETWDAPYSTDRIGFVCGSDPDDALWGTSTAADTRCVPGIVAEHIAGHDPAAVLAGIETDRAILAEHPALGSFCERCTDGGDFGELIEWPCRTVLLVASRYRHRAGYQAGWKP